MDKFNYIDELKKIAANRQLVEVRFVDKLHEFHVAYLLDANDQYLTFVEIDPEGNPDGICMYRVEDVRSIKAETSYVEKLAKKVNSEVYKQALKDIERIKTFSFEGFCSAFQGTNTLVEVFCVNDEDLAGTIVGFDKNGLALNEYNEHQDGRVGYTLVSYPAIDKLSVSVPWLKNISIK